MTRKTSSKSSSIELLHLSIVDSIKKHGKVPKIGLSKTALQYHLSLLKKKGLIEKIGYGTWQAKEVQFFTQTTTHADGINCTSFDRDKIRGHGFRFKLKIPAIKGWDSRERVLEDLGFHWKPVILGQGRGQSFQFNEHTFWLFPNSIIIILPKGKDWYDTKAETIKQTVMIETIQLVKDLEVKLKVSLKVGKGYAIRMYQQHYAFVDNIIAKQRINENQPLKVYDWDGLWLLVDLSTGLPELECVHPVTSQKDADDVILRDYNETRQTGLTPKVTLAILDKHEELLDRISEGAIKPLTEQITLHLKVQKATLRALQGINVALGQRRIFKPEAHQGASKGSKKDSHLSDFFKGDS